MVSGRAFPPLVFMNSGFLGIPPNGTMGRKRGNEPDPPLRPDPRNFSLHAGTVDHHRMVQQEMVAEHAPLTHSLGGIAWFPCKNAPHHHGTCCLSYSRIFSFTSLKLNPCDSAISLILSRLFSTVPRIDSIRERV